MIAWLQDPEHVWIAIVSGSVVLSLAVLLGVFLYRQNRRLLGDAVTAQAKLTQAALDSLSKQQQELNAEAARTRQAMLSEFLDQQRARDEDLRREQHKRDADRRLRDESQETAWAHWFQRVKAISDERIPRIEARVLDLEGRMFKIETGPKVPR